MNHADIYLNDFATNSETSFDISSVNNNKIKLQKVFNLKAKFLTNKLYNLNELIRIFKTTETGLEFDQTALDTQGIHTFNLTKKMKQTI
jgi:hypothetical protein